MVMRFILLTAVITQITLGCEIVMRKFLFSLAPLVCLCACSTGPVNASGSAEASNAASEASSAHSEARTASPEASSRPSAPTASQTPLREPESVTLNRFYGFVETTMSSNLDASRDLTPNGHLTSKAKKEILESLSYTCETGSIKQMARNDFAKAYRSEVISDSFVYVSDEKAQAISETLWDVCHLPSIQQVSQLINAQHLM